MARLVERTRTPGVIAWVVEFSYKGWWAVPQPKHRRGIWPLVATFVVAFLRASDQIRSACLLVRQHCFAIGLNRLLCFVLNESSIFDRKLWSVIPWPASPMSAFVRCALLSVFVSTSPRV